MEKDEKIKVLMEKAKISHEEAEEALEKNDWDLLDSIIYLERKGKMENEAANTIIEVAGQSKEENKKQSDQKRSGGIGSIVGKIFKFVGKIIKKGNKHHFEIAKENEKPIRITLTISALLLILAFWAVAILLVIGLFCGYKYSITGPNINTDKVNDILGKASESADNIKDDFKRGYNS